MTNTFTLHHGKSEEVLRDYPDNHFCSVVCDPPYHLTSIVKRFGGDNAAAAQFGTDGAYARAARGFMGKQWDGGDIAFRPEFWAEVYRVLKPGGHLLAFSGSRTYHRMAVGIEDAGFEIRDKINWIYGSGFNKSHDIARNIDKIEGVKREVIGTKLVTKIDYAPGEVRPIRREFMEVSIPTGLNAKLWAGWGTSIKPAHEPICMARKPISEKSVAANVLKWRTGAVNIEGCKVTNEDAEQNRHPANVVTSEIEEWWTSYFYCAKASQKDRDDGLEGAHNIHPTVKPIDLMRWLCRLVTPPGGTILDPFMGSGSTGKAAMLEGFKFVGIDMTEEYIEVARKRIQTAYDQVNAIENVIVKDAAQTNQQSIFDGITTADLPLNGSETA